MIDRRLADVMSKVKESVALPVIVNTRVPVTSSVVSELSGAGMRVTRTSKVSPIVYGFATPVAIRNIDSLDIVSTVYYDEPVYPAVLPGIELRLKKKSIVMLGDSVRLTGANMLHEEGVTGKGVRVGVIDTGVSLEHEMLRRSIAGTYSAVPGESVNDMNSHGSWTASAACGDFVSDVMFGVAPDSSLFALKALSDRGTGQTSWVMDCIEKAVVDFRCDVLSMSLGGLFDGGGADPVSRLVNDVVSKYNVVCVVAAGNSFVPASIGSPGGALLALTVGSVSVGMPSVFAPSTFSSKGPVTAGYVKPDVSAPGGQVLAPGIVELIHGAGAGNTYADMAGSSMSTPQVAGSVALLRSVRDGLSRADVEQLIAMASFPHPKDTVTGYGPINVYSMYQNIDNINPFFSGISKPIDVLQSMASIPFEFVNMPYYNNIREVRLPYITG